MPTVNEQEAVSELAISRQNAPPTSRTRNRKRKKYVWMCEYHCEGCCDFKGNNKKRDGVRECYKCGSILLPQKQVKGIPEPWVPKGRCYGFYRCEDCDKKWTSAYCWPGHTQDCKECLNKIEAYQKKPLRRKPGNVTGDNPAHMSPLCGKCKSLGHVCAQAARMSRTEE